MSERNWAAFAHSIFQYIERDSLCQRRKFLGQIPPSLPRNLFGRRQQNTPTPLWLANFSCRIVARLTLVAQKIAKGSGVFRFLPVWKNGL